MKLLHLDTSINQTGSVSRAISSAIVEKLLRDQPELEVIYRDLVAQPVPHLDRLAVTGLSSGVEVQQFLDADVIVIGVAFYNFTISSQLRAWIDHIVVAGRTFQYTETGPVGLVENTRIIIAVARGGVYGDGSHMASLEHAETLLRGVFVGLTGLTPEFVIAEGTMMGEAMRDAALRNALEKVARLPALEGRRALMI